MLNAERRTQYLKFNKAIMKTSNKIILAYFLFALLGVTAVHVTLYAKYKRGEFVPFDKVREDRMEEIALPGIKYVTVTGLQRCNILPATEPKMKMQKMSGGRLKYTIVKDTLIIIGDTVLTQENMYDGRRGYQTVHLYLPGTPTINAVYTDLFLNGAPDTTSAQSYVVNLSNQSVLNTGDMNFKKAFFKGLQVSDNGSIVKFNYGTVMNELNLQAENRAKITNENADIKHIQLQMDDQSTIILQGKNLKDINVVKE